MEPVTFITYLILIVAGIAISAFLTGSEVAVFALVGREEELEEDNKADARILKLLSDSQILRSSFLIAITFINVITALSAAFFVSNLISYAGGNPVLGYTVAIIVLTFLLLVLSTITPKITAINNPLHLARRNSYIIVMMYYLLKPPALAVEAIKNKLEQLLPKASKKMTSEEIRNITEQDYAESEHSMKEDEREIIENVIEFGSISVKEIMTSRVNIVAVNVEDSLKEVLQLIREKNLSRLPLFENDLDNIIGILYAKDVLAYLDSEENDLSLNWRTIARKALFIPDSKKLDDLLRDFQQEKTHIAVVVDEYGGTEGIITMDDILEEIVGDFSDDDGDETTIYTQFKSGIYIFDAKINLDDLEEILGCEISDEDDDFETLGGLIYHLIESLPTVGERISYKNLELTVHSVQNNRIKKVRVKVEDKKVTPVED